MCIFTVGGLTLAVVAVALSRDVHGAPRLGFKTFTLRDPITGLRYVTFYDLNISLIPVLYTGTSAQIRANVIRTRGKSPGTALSASPEVHKAGTEIVAGGKVRTRCEDDTG